MLLGKYILWLRVLVYVENVEFMEIVGQYMYWYSYHYHYPYNIFITYKGVLVIHIMCEGICLRVYGLRFKVHGLVFRVYGLLFTVYGLGF